MSGRRLVCGVGLCVPQNVRPVGLTTSLTPVNLQSHRKETMDHVCGRGAAGGEGPCVHVRVTGRGEGGALMGVLRGSYEDFCS